MDDRPYLDCSECGEPLFPATARACDGGKAIGRTMHECVACDSSGYVAAKESAGATVLDAKYNMDAPEVPPC